MKSKKLHNIGLQTLYYLKFLLYLRIVYTMKRVVILLVLLVQAFLLWAQESSSQPTTQATTTNSPKKSTFWTTSKITYGGSFGFTINSHEYYLMVMPEVGYQLFEPWHFAIAPKYSYNNTYGYYARIAEHTLGIRISTRFDFIQLKKYTAYKTKLFLSLAYMYEYHWGYYSPYQTNYFDAAIGIRQSVGTRGYMYVMAGWHLYDSYQEKWFPEAIPTISVGFEY